ncbi:unnamed protein product [Brugia pahangi]|uniref:Reverse transcriptase domain-containing protein n=1 Tax=Brugia pahangi TaxID=6280 RepID=A0A0N4TLB3_BRUPA|nr:unnamed protein product [Brugia pahangi]
MMVQNMPENCNILAKGLKMLQQQKFGSVVKRPVQEVLHAVGSKCGIEPSVIDEIDLDNLIEETIAQNEGKLPSPFIDEENPLSPSSTTIKSPSSIEELFKMYFVSLHI